MPDATTLPAMPTFGQRFAALPSGQRTRLGVGLLLLVVLLVAGIVIGRQPDWRVLYSGLSDKDGGAIVAQLAQMNVPYKYSEGGGAIMVPSDRVYDARLRLASQGLPKGSVAGFELMENNRFGMTQFQERLNFQRGLEGELTRSIQALSSVQSARVHLALPNQNGFFREQQKPSASVLLSLYPGATLDRAQIAGIVHLVAASVPEMTTSAVSVLDDSGKLLSTPTDGSDALAGVDAQQLQYVQQLEQTYRRRILEILEPVVGRNNVKAQVSADIDFSQSESTSESHRPNQTPDATAIRSQQVIESSNGAGSGQPPSGVPGATTNQPPGTASAPVNGTAQALSPGTGNGGAGAGAAGGGSKRESITNYEVDKTVRVVRAGSGAVRRISAAVVLNHQSVTDERGRTTVAPLPAEQIEKMTALVRETIGFNRERGDSVNVVNAPFAAEKVVPVEVPVWKDPQVLDLTRSLAWPVGLLLLALVVLLGVVRPAIKALAAPPRAERDAEPAAGDGLDAVVSDTPERAPLLAGGTTVDAVPMSEMQLHLEEARRLTHENPVAVANIVKRWMGSEPNPGST